MGDIGYKKPPEHSKFKKGQSGNPNGKAKGVPNAKTRYQRILNLIEKVKNPVTGEIEDFTVAEIMDMKVMQKARSGDLKAYKEIMDRLEGRAAQGIDLTSSDGSMTPTVIIEGVYGNKPKFRPDNQTTQVDAMATDSSE